MFDEKIIQEINVMIHEYTSRFEITFSRLTFVFWGDNEKIDTFFEKIVLFHSNSIIIYDINELNTFKLQEYVVFLAFNGIDNYINAYEQCKNKGIDDELIMSFNDLKSYLWLRIKVKTKFEDYNDIKKYVASYRTKDCIEMINHFEQLNFCYSKLSDAKSKIIFLKLVAKKIIGINNCDDILCKEMQYFDTDIVVLTDDETYLDVGSYDGETIINFINCVKNYNKIISFEPSQLVYNKLLTNVIDIDRIDVFPIGLGDAIKEMNFNELPYGASFYSSDGIHVRKMIPGDSMGISPTFIKMDIEGCELAALEGLENTIKEYSPTLAICIYHKFNDLWQIPQYIISNFDYKHFYIRHYSNNISETVFYAIK